MSKKVSIIVPVYNAENYISRIYEAILKQTYKNFEIIFVNDGSSDNTHKIVLDIQKQDHRVIVADKTNEGPGSARNTGLELASGDYITFIDCDDSIAENFLETMINAIQDCDICICKYVRIKKNQNYVFTDFPKGDFFISGRKSVNYYFKKRTGTLMVVPWAKLFRSSFIKKYRFDSKLKSEDTDLSYRYLFEAGKIHFIPDSLYFYFENDNSDSSMISFIREIDILTVFSRRSFYFLNRDSNFYSLSCLHFYNYLFGLIWRNRNTPEKINIIKINISQTPHLNFNRHFYLMLKVVFKYCVIKLFTKQIFK